MSHHTAPAAPAHAQSQADAPWLSAIASHGFRFVRSEPIAEINGNAYQLIHDASGAKLLYLANDDIDRAFAISFKTPPADDTGVFHILEHSVLCGSDKFPVKEPFVNLLKTSMQTFLNAMTFPDKTMYPVASTNEQDLLNLMDVYLDAVFHPAIYRKETIFAQEGWHLEVDRKADTSSLIYNGVVYNEMKGALSEPDAVLWNALAKGLFPDTAYGFESGGKPEAITELTYEAFLATHRRHYRPDNAAIILYGTLDIDRVLGFLDQEYLTPLAREFSGDGALGDGFEDGLGSGSPNPLRLQAPCVALNLREPMVTAPENAEAALGYVIGTASDRLKIIACDILFDAIMGSNESPLKRAILEAEIGTETYATTGDSILQPFVALTLKGCGKDGARQLQEVVEKEARRLADGGLDHELIEASLAHSEFVLREHDLGISDGVAYAISVMASWLYDDDDACAYLRYEDVFAELRARLADGYFEALLRELVLENPHRASVNLIPVPAPETDAGQEELAAKAAELGSAGLAEVERATEVLRQAQEAPDSPKALATLPMLSLHDIGAGPAEQPWHLDRTTPVPTLRHGIDTHGILYMNRYCALPGFPGDDLGLLTILATVLGKLDTAHHSAAELDTLCQTLLGNLTFFPEVDEDARGSLDYNLTFVVATSVLSASIAPAMDLVAEILNETDFSDLGKIKRILVQRKVAIEQTLIGAGQSVALRRAASYFLPAGAVREALEGFAYYQYLVDLLDHFEERGPALAARLDQLARWVAQDSEVIVSLAGSEMDVEAFWKSGERLAGPGWDAVAPWAFVGIEGDLGLGQREEAIIVPADVSFTAVASDRRLLDIPASGLWSVASNALSYDYLWNEIRVKGGAYGCGFRVSRNGALNFYTYRDPHLDESLDRIARAGTWLESFSPSKSEMDGYIISTTATYDAPLKPRTLMRRQDGEFLGCYDPKLRTQRRSEVLTASVDALRALGAKVREVVEQRMICTVGDKALLEASKRAWTFLNPFGL